MANYEDAETDGYTSNLYLHLCLSLIAIISFWCQSIVTEERLVPALNVLADYHGIPDDVAGATLMAAGASSPELLCTLVSLFITHSSLGLGTIVGSEIFNQLIICAGSVYATKSKVLVLDRRMVVREVVFYGLSIALLYVALSESRIDADYDGNEEDGVYEYERIYVSFWKACLLFGGYILYVVVCANMKFVEKCIHQFMVCFRFMRGEAGVESPNNTTEDSRGKTSDPDGNTQSDYQLEMMDCVSNLDPSPHCSIGACTSFGSVHYKSFDDPELHQLPFIYNVTTEPVENWENTPKSDENIVITNSSLSSNCKNAANNSIKKKRSILSAAIHKSFQLIKANHLLCRDDYPVEINDVYELTSNEGSHEIGCFMWQRSIFYTKAYFGSHAFHLRWFAITPQRIVSMPDRQEPDKHVIVYPLFDEIHVDERRLIIYIVNPLEGRRDFTLMAPSKAIFDAVVQGFEQYMNATQPLRLQGMTELDDGDETQKVLAASVDKRDIDADPHVELIELPRNASMFELALWVSLFPLRLIMHYTLPDVRHLDHHGQPQKSISYAYLSTISCLIWLILGSYVMVTSLESLAALMGIPDAIMGVTLSAAGTSMPAYIASRMAAEKGFGNAAVANVFGSNTFNICVGLGLPWVIFISVIGFEPYHDLENEGVLESILIMAGVLLIFVVLMISSNFVLVKWHANLFIGLYCVYITRIFL
ncbi:hypothetical protein ACHAXR_003376 [Thalassiosira sp. AJA248-18]